MRILEGNLVTQGLKVGIVVGRFNEFIVSKLLGGALDGLKRHGVEENNIDIAWVPGAFEIPLVAKKMAKNDKYDVVICYKRSNTSFCLCLYRSFKRNCKCITSNRKTSNLWCFNY